MKHNFGSIGIGAGSMFVAASLAFAPVDYVFAQARPRSGAEAPSQRFNPWSFKDIAAVVGREVPGRILRIRHIRREGRWVYMARVLRPDGKRRDVLVDAATLKILEKSEDREK